MAATNGFFGQIQGPFTKNKEVFTKIQSQCLNPINYISKIGIHFVGNSDLDLEGKRQGKYFVKINNIQFQLGKTRMLELEDVKITSIKFTQNVSDKVYIDYQYK